MHLILATIVLLLAVNANASTPVRVAAAADLQLALPIILEEYEKINPDSNISITFGSSGVFTSQLRNGAPFELFFSANAEFIEILVKDELTLDEGIQYAFGRVAFMSLEPLAAESASQAILEWHLIAHPSHKLSIANPTHAPYGMAATDWLKYLSLESTINSRLVLGENAAQSVQFVLAGAARSGIVAWPLIANRKNSAMQAWLIPEHEHIVLKQKMVLMKNASPIAMDFYQFMQTDKTRDILTEYGFGVP